MIFVLTYPEIPFKSQALVYSLWQRLYADSSDSFLGQADAVSAYASSQRADIRLISTNVALYILLSD